MANPFDSAKPATSTNPFDAAIARSTSSGPAAPAPTPTNVQNFPLMQDFGMLRSPSREPIDFTQANIKPPKSELPIGIAPTIKPILQMVMPELVNANDAVIAAIADRSMKPLSEFWEGYKVRGADRAKLFEPIKETDSPELVQEKQQHLMDAVMGFVNPSTEVVATIKQIAKSTNVREIGETIRGAFPYLKDVADDLAERLAAITNPAEVETFLREANQEAWKLHVTDAAQSVQKGLFDEGAPAPTPKQEGVSLDTIQTKPELFQQSRSFEKTAGGGGFEPYKVAEIGKQFDESRLIKNPISVGLFDDGYVVTSGHNRLEILRQAKAKGLLTRPDKDYINITDYRGQGGLQAAIDESITSNIASKSVKDINLLDLYIRGSINEGQLKNALSFDEKKIKFFTQVANTFKDNGLVDMWSGSVGQKLADLKSLDFGVMQERLNFVNGIAKKTGDAIKDLSPQQKVAVQDQVSKLIQQYMSTSKRTTLAAVEGAIGRALEVIRQGGFKNEQLTNLFGEIVTQSEVQKKVPVQAFQKLIADNLKSAVLPESTKARLAAVQTAVANRGSLLGGIVNREGGLTANAGKNVKLLQDVMALSDTEFAAITGTTKVSGETTAAAEKIVENATAYQHQFTEGVQDVARSVGHEAQVGPVKSPSRIAQKTTVEYGGDMSKVRDANRAVIFIDDARDVAPIINAVKAKFGVLTRPPKSSLSLDDIPQGSYQSVILNIKTPLGHDAEIQLTTPEMWKASHEQGGHQLYEQVRSKFANWQKAQDDMEALYARADEEGKINAAKRSEVRLASSVRQADSEIASPRSDALMGEKGRPDASAIPKTSVPSESTMTGEPSTSKYLGKDESAIPSQYTPEDGIAQLEKGSTVGEGTESVVRRPAAARDTPREGQKRVIDDRIPLPPSIGEIMMKNGKSVPVERTPADTLEELVGKISQKKKLRAKVEMVQEGYMKEIDEDLNALRTKKYELEDSMEKERKSWQSVVRGYMYNHTPNKKAHAFDYYATPEFVLEKVGLGKAAELLQNAKDVYRTTLKKEFTKLDEWMARVSSGQSHMQDGRRMVHTPQDSSRLIFQWLDGQEREVSPFMSDAEKEVAREIRAYLKEWADRLHLPEENRIGKYITHIFERDAKQKGMSEFDDPELAEIMSKQVAGTVYDPFLQKRMGAQEYIEDAWRALDAYVKRASRKEAMDPALERLVDDAAKLDDYTYQYVKDMSHRINMRPTPNEKGVDNFIKQTWIGERFTDRPTAFLSKKIRTMFYRGTLGLNAASALRNLSQGANTYAKLGEKYTVIGYSKLFGKMASNNLDELFEVGVLDDGFVQDRATGVIRKNIQRMDDVLFSLFTFAEKINRGAAYFGAKAQGLKKGLSEEEAVKYAKRIVRETQFAFSAVDTPVGLNDDIIKTLAQLQTYNIKQGEFLGRMLKQKDFAGLLRWTAATLGYVYSIGTIFGMTPDQIIPTIGLGKAPLTSTLTNLPFLFSDDPQTKAKAQSQLQRNISTFIPAGAQIRKSIQGAEAYAAGKDVTKTGRLRYTIDDDPATLVRVLLFGKSSLPQAQEYYEGIGKKKETKGNPFD